MKNTTTGLVVILTILTGCHQDGDASVFEQHPNSAEEVATTSTGEIFYLDSEELNSQMRLAKRGNTNSAMRVARHFSLGENDVEKSIPWLKIAAEQGDIVAMQNIATSLSILGGRRNCEAALAWLERASQEHSASLVTRREIEASISHRNESFAECIERAKEARGN